MNKTEELNEFEKEILGLIVEECKIKHPLADIFPDTPLVGENSPFGLDSLDVVEIAVAVQRRYGVRIGDSKTGRQVLSSLRNLADYVRNPQNM